MSLLVEVQRGAGDKPGADIVLQYYSSQEAAREAGRVAIDRAATGFKLVAGNINGIRSFVRPGAIIRNIDMRQGDMRAKVLACSGIISVDDDGKPSASIGLQMRRKSRG